MTETGGFSVGICASDSTTSLLSLLPLVREEEFGGSYLMQRLIIVASGCPPGVLSRLEAEATRDDRILTIAEPERRGKAEAINRIIDNAVGEYLVLLNADAVPVRGAIRRILKELSDDPRAGCVSARPLLREGSGPLSQVLSLMWSAHNLASLRLNHSSMSNHSSDELLAVRRNLMSHLPSNLVNDGAYIGGLLKRSGHLVKFSREADVSISVPARPADLIGQRRRIIYGHVQVWRNLGTPPKTVESLLFMKPLLGLSMLVSLFARRPRLVFALPFAVVTEILSAIMAMFDLFSSGANHVVWKRYAT